MIVGGRRKGGQKEWRYKRTWLVLWVPSRLSWPGWVRESITLPRALLKGEEPQFSSLLAGAFMGH